MPRPIDREGLQRLQAAGAYVVEVLPREEYEENHLPGALHIPLRDIDNAREELDQARPVVVYCWDSA